MTRHFYLAIVRIAAMCALVILASPHHAAAESPAPAVQTAPASQPAKPWYESEIAAFEAQDRAAPPTTGGVLFIGSSSFRMWNTLAEDMKPIAVLNRGFGGSKTHEVLAVYDRIVRPYAPRVIVYYCGDNDLGTDNTDSQAAADNFIAFARRARKDWPQVRVLYVAIKPSLARWKNWPAMRRANDLVRAFCENDQNTEFLDVATPMLTADGKPDPTIFMDDGLHLNARGYAIWTGVIRLAVAEAMSAQR